MTDILVDQDDMHSIVYFIMYASHSLKSLTDLAVRSYRIRQDPITITSESRNLTFPLRRKLEVGTDRDGVELFCLKGNLGDFEP